MDELEIKPDLEQLRGYTRIKQALAGELRQLRQGLAALGREEAEHKCKDLMVKLAEDRFTLAVVGQFKRGKSSLMNAIIGQELLPTGVLPLTSAITVLRYGPSEQLVITRNGLSFPEQLPIGVLADYVTEKGNPGNRKKILTARLELPVPFLRYGIEFVDTPGIGSAIDANTATTYDFLPECDVLLFVTAADSPLTSGELVFLEDIRQYVRKIFFVVNKIDLLSPDEGTEVSEYVEKTVREKLGNGEIRIYLVSSRDGLRSRLEHDTTLYQQSGLKALEDALGAFLSEEKSSIFLEAIAQKALRIVDAEKNAGAFDESALLARAAEQQQQRVRVMQQEPHEAMSTVMGARERLVELGREANWRAMAVPEGVVKPVREEAVGNVLGSIGGAPLPAAENPESGVGLEKGGGEKESVLKTRTCPVCAEMARQAQDFLIHWQYELTTLDIAQERFADELGFCPLHTWQMVAIASPYGASVGYARLSDRVAALLRETRISEGEKVGRLVRNSRTCRVCGLLAGFEASSIEGIAELIGRESGRLEYGRSEGTCLRHLGRLIAAVSEEELRAFLLADAAGRFERGAEDMRGYAIKRDALRRGLQNTDEEDAYYRTMIRIVGDRNVCVPWPEDGEI